MHPNNPLYWDNSPHKAEAHACLLNKLHAIGTELPTWALRRGCVAGSDGGSAAQGWGETPREWAEGSSCRKGSASRFSVSLFSCGGGGSAGGGWRGLPERTRGCSGKSKGLRIWGQRDISYPRPPHPRSPGALVQGGRAVVCTRTSHRRGPARLPTRPPQALHSDSLEPQQGCARSCTVTWRGAQPWRAAGPDWRMVLCVRLQTQDPLVVTTSARRRVWGQSISLVPTTAPW